MMKNKLIYFRFYIYVLNNILRKYFYDKYKLMLWLRRKYIELGKYIYNIFCIGI